MMLWDIRNNIEKVIEIFLEVAEENGQDGDYYLFEHFTKKAEALTKAKEELKGLNNVNIIPEIHADQLKSFVPNLNLKDYREGLGILLTRKRHQLELLEKEVSDLDVFMVEMSGFLVKASKITGKGPC